MGCRGKWPDMTTKTAGKVSLMSAMLASGEVLRAWSKNVDTSDSY